MSNYTVYHLHSDYSLLDSTTQYADYVARAKELGMTAIASTEHGRPLGWIHKKLMCDEAGIKFMHGVEIYLTENLDPKVRDNYHTVLIARNYEGVKEINRLVGLSGDEEHFYYNPRISFDEFLKLSPNVITTSACLASSLNKLDENDPWIEKLISRYDYLEVQPHNCDEQRAFNKRLLEWSKRFSKPLIAGTDTHNISQYKAECRAILLARKHKSYGDEDKFDLNWKTYDELVQAFKTQDALSEEEYLEAIENTNRLADSVENFEIDTAIKYPILYGSYEEDVRVFKNLTEQMFSEKLASGVIPASQSDGFRRAIEEETEVFEKLGMCGFMLCMSELVRWCKSNGIAIGTARGSVGGSRIAYIIDIIDLNPEQWHTVFSRFANADRKEIGDQWSPYTAMCRKIAGEPAHAGCRSRG